MKTFTLQSLIVFLGILFTSSYYAQQVETKFVQFVFTNLESREKAKEIDEFMRSQPGITMSRSDNASKKYLVLFQSNSAINKEQIEIWMLQLGMTFKCYREGYHGIDTIIHQTLDCE
jgi:phage-related protein